MQKGEIWNHEWTGTNGHEFRPRFSLESQWLSVVLGVICGLPFSLPDLFLMGIEFRMAAARFVAEGARRLSGHIAEPGAEVLGVGETGKLADLLDRQVGGEQQALGFLDPAHLKKLHG